MRIRYQRSISPWRIVLLAIAIAGLVHPCVEAQTPYMVSDLNTNSDVDELWATELAVVNDLLFFSSTRLNVGRELWVSDGTESGTVLVRDIRIGSSGSNPKGIVDLGGVAVFLADDGVHGTELWRSDGTLAGTSMIIDLTPGPDDSDISNLPDKYLTSSGGLAFFIYDDGIHGYELWRTDGTSAGTFMAKDLNPGSLGGLEFSRDLIDVDGTLFFSAGNATYGNELWKSDGTESGTVLVKDIGVGFSSGPEHLTLAGSTVFFVARDILHGRELWKSDGTDAGTSMVADIRIGTGSSSPAYLVPVGDRIFFRAEEPASVYKLYFSDGTASGTIAVYDQGLPFPKIGFDNKLYFTAWDATNGDEFWTSDGTVSGTSLFKDIWPGNGSSSPGGAAIHGATLFFHASDGVSGKELWKTDGTPSGTVLVEDLRPGLDSSVNSVPWLTSASGSLFLVANDGASGVSNFRLWKTGESGGIDLVLDPEIRTEKITFNYPVGMGGILYFSGNIYSDSAGEELWRSDASAAGTYRVKDINPGAASSYPWFAIVVNNQLHFSARDVDFGNEPFTSDGSDTGTQRLADINPGTGHSSASEFAALGPLLIFQAENDSSIGRELWRSDGTAGGTSLIRDIRLGSGDSNPVIMSELGGELIFRCNDGVHGQELWKTDGDPGGTDLLVDIRSGASSGLNYSFEILSNGFLYFEASDGTHGKELWRTDGSAAGTHIVKDINQGSGSALSFYSSWGTSFGDILLFAANDGTTGEELWRSDGTAEGTALVKDIAPGTTSSEIRGLAVTDDAVFFVADDGVHGRELWRTDGSEAGTTLVKDILTGPEGSAPLNLVANSNGTVFFSAYRLATGNEMWRSDGTEAGTSLVSDIRPGQLDGGFEKPTIVDDIVYFTADDGVHGSELWAACVSEFFEDQDEDGYGRKASVVFACSQPAGTVTNDDDCDDDNEDIHPGATEICDSVDNDCDGEIDDPTFAGVTSATALGGGNCAIRLDWSSTTACDGTPVYNIYRSPTSGFEPRSWNLQAACVAQDFWIDTGVTPGTPYAYVIRAENPSVGGNGPCYGGAEDNNTVEVSATATSCSAAAQEVLYFTACARDEQVQLEWVNPSASYGLTRVCWKETGFPSGPTDGVCVDDLTGIAGAYGTTIHDSDDVGGIENDTLYYYGAFVNSHSSGAGDWSAGRFITARPFDTTQAGKWAYSTPATALSPPGVLPGSASFSASNDRLLHSSVAGPAGGEWPASWVPASMNGPAQGRPIVLPFGTPTVGGASTIAFVGSHDGRVYAFDANTGVELWASDMLGDGIQASPSASLVAFGGSHDVIVVGTRTPGGDSKLYGLRLADGFTAWAFDNGGGSNGIGIISSQAWVDGANTRAYFTSRTKAIGSNHTVWCVDFTATTASLVWSRNLGDIDSAPTVRGGAVYVGTNAGTVHALDPLTGDDLWSAPFATGDGAIRGYVWFDQAGGDRRLYFSTSNSVHALTDGGGSASAYWAPVSLAAPSPVIVIGDDLYVGSSVANGSLVRLDKVTGTQLGNVGLGDPSVAKQIGSPSYDWIAGQVVVGTEQGVVYAVNEGF